MLRRLLPGLAAALVALSVQASAQCSSLSVDSALDPSTLFQTVTIEVTGSVPLSPHVLVVGPTPGETVLSLGGTSLTLGLAQPFVSATLGVSDASGDLLRELELPAGLGWTAYAQSVGIELVPGGRRPALALCESNVDDVTL